VVLRVVVEETLGHGQVRLKQTFPASVGVFSGYHVAWRHTVLIVTGLLKAYDLTRFFLIN